MNNWYKTFIKTSQSAPTRQSTSIYRGIMVYEVEVPSSGDAQSDEKRASEEAANLYQKVFRAVGDEVLSFDSPSLYRNT